MGRPKKADGTRVRDVAPTGVRLAPELRDQLVRLAAISGRTLSGEMQWRLRESVERHNREAASGAVHGGPLHAPLQTPLHAPLLTAEPPQRYREAPPLSDPQRMMLAVFDALAPDKQLALITLLRR